MKKQQLLLSTALMWIAALAPYAGSATPTDPAAPPVEAAPPAEQKPAAGTKPESEAKSPETEAQKSVEQPTKSTEESASSAPQSSPPPAPDTTARDPFSPYTMWDMQNGFNGGVKNAPNSKEALSNPLEKAQLSNYRVVGTIIAPAETVAVIKTPEFQDYLVHVGDKVGNEGGVIEAITEEGISVNMQSSTLELPVKNKIEMPQNESSTKQDKKK